MEKAIFHTMYTTYDGKPRVCNKDVPFCIGEAF